MRWWGNFLIKVPPHPLKNFRTKNLKVISNTPIASRREVKPRFCYRKRAGTSKTLPVKRVDLQMQNNDVLI